MMDYREYKKKNEGREARLSRDGFLWNFLGENVILVTGPDMMSHSIDLERLLSMRHANLRLKVLSSLMDVDWSFWTDLYTEARDRLIKEVSSAFDTGKPWAADRAEIRLSRLTSNWKEYRALGDTETEDFFSYRKLMERRKEQSVCLFKVSNDMEEASFRRLLMTVGIDAECFVQYGRDMRRVVAVIDKDADVRTWRLRLQEALRKTTGTDSYIVAGSDAAARFFHISKAYAEPGAEYLRPDRFDSSFHADQRVLKLLPFMRPGAGEDTDGSVRLFMKLLSEKEVMESSSPEGLIGSATRFDFKEDPKGILKSHFLSLFSEGWDSEILYSLVEDKWPPFRDALIAKRQGK